LTLGTLLVHEGRVVIADGGESACFDAESGQLLWYETFTGCGVGPVSLAVPGVAAQCDRRG